MEASAYELLRTCSQVKSLYLREIIQFDENLINLAVGELAHHVFVFVIWLFAICIVLTAALFFLIVVVHKIVLVVEIIFGNVDVAKSVCNGVSRRGFEVLQERLEGSWRGAKSVFCGRPECAMGAGVLNCAS